MVQPGKWKRWVYDTTKIKIEIETLRRWWREE